MSSSVRLAMCLTVLSIIVDAIPAHTAEIALPSINDGLEERFSLNLSDISKQPRSFPVLPFDYGSETRPYFKHVERLLKKSGLRRDARVEEGQTESFAAMPVGPLRISASLLDSVKGRHNDAYFPEAARTLGRLTATLPLLEGSFLDLSYGRGGSGATPRLQTWESGRWVLKSAALSRDAEFGSYEEVLEGSLYQWTRASDLRLTSTYSSARNELRDGRETVTVYHDVDASAYLTEWLTISPRLGLWQETHRWSGVRSEGLWASPSVTFGPFFDVFKLKAYAYYDSGRSDDGTWDARNREVALQLVWKMKRFSLGKSALLFEVGRSDYRDRVYRSSSSTALFGGVYLAVHRF